MTKLAMEDHVVAACAMLNFMQSSVEGDMRSK